MFNLDRPMIWAVYIKRGEVHADTFYADAAGKLEYLNDCALIRTYPDDSDDSEQKAKAFAYDIMVHGGLAYDPAKEVAKVVD